jgi:hypothetical protein
VTIRREGSTLYSIEREKGTALVDFNTDDPVTLRERAREMRERAALLLRLAGDAEVIADLEERVTTERAAVAAEQQKTRAAATRARNADPFGFKALGIKIES